jgi:hypothetical protein
LNPRWLKAPIGFRDRLVSRLALCQRRAVRPLCLERPWRNSSRPFGPGASILGGVDGRACDGGDCSLASGSLSAPISVWRVRSRISSRVRSACAGAYSSRSRSRSVRCPMRGGRSWFLARGRGRGSPIRASLARATGDPGPEKGGCDGYADSSGAAGQENLTTHLVTSSVRARCRTRCVVRSRSRSEVRVW